MRPSRDQICMIVAQVIASRTTCNKNSGVGTVLARDGRILATGYNGAPAGQPHCMHFCTCGEEVHTDDCAMRVPCENAVHAECNAIAYAARHGVPLEGADMYTTYSPCLACAQLVVNAGIARVFFATEFRDARGLQLLQRAQVQVVCLEI